MEWNSVCFELRQISSGLKIAQIVTWWFCNATDWYCCKQVNKIRMAGGLRSSVPQRAASEIRILFSSESGVGRPCQRMCVSEVVVLMVPELECWRANIADGENTVAVAFLTQTPSGLLNGTSIFASLNALTYKVCFQQRQTGQTAAGRPFVETGLTLNIQRDHVVLYANQRIQQPTSTLPGLMVIFCFQVLVVPWKGHRN